MSRILKKLRIESKMANLRVVENAVDDITNKLGIKEDNYGKILVATLEAVNNAIAHGNNGDPEKIVEIEITIEKNQIKVKITDEGEGFNPDSIPDPTMPENIEEISGRGVFLMTKLSDKIKFNKKGNSVTMTFKEVDA